MTRFRFLLAAALTAALCGCTGLFHSNARPDQVYYLRATPSENRPAPLAVSLRFAHPTVNPGLDTSQIVLVQSDRRMGYYVASRWPATVPNLIETLSVEKLRAAGGWRSITDSESSFPSDYVLQVTVRRFEADYTGGGIAPEVHVVFDCMVGKREGREVVTSFLAEGTAPARANKMSAVVAAFEIATNAAIDSMSSQAAEAVRGALTHH